MIKVRLDLNLMYVFLLPERDCYVWVFAIANPSVVCLSITFVHPTQPVETFRIVSMPFCTLAIR